MRGANLAIMENPWLMTRHSRQVAARLWSADSRRKDILIPKGFCRGDCCRALLCCKSLLKFLPLLPNEESFQRGDVGKFLMDLFLFLCEKTLTGNSQFINQVNQPSDPSRPAYFKAREIAPLIFGGNMFKFVLLILIGVRRRGPHFQKVAQSRHNRLTQVYQAGTNP